MSKARIHADRQQSILDGLSARLKSLDCRIARMRQLHAGSDDPLARRLIGHSLAERAELLAKLPPAR
jgi:hypothetical protein